MTAHSNISKAQSTCLMIQKENLDSDTCIIMIDFAENYQYVLEDEIQSFHWNNNQCSIIKMYRMSFRRSYFVLYQKI